jgi:hypothetical protein
MKGQALDWIDRNEKSLSLIFKIIAVVAAVMILIILHDLFAVIAYAQGFHDGGGDENMCFGSVPLDSLNRLIWYTKIPENVTGDGMFAGREFNRTFADGWCNSYLLKEGDPNASIQDFNNSISLECPNGNTRIWTLKEYKLDWTDQMGNWMQGCKVI